MSSGKSFVFSHLRLVFSFFFVSAWARPAGRRVGDSMAAKVKSFCIRAFGLGMTQTSPALCGILKSGRFEAAQSGRLDESQNRKASPPTWIAAS